jgi:protein-S-isoprenylcysteine O-methyltransferase Ste14
VIATGLMVGAMWMLGLVFAGIWIYLLRVRQEILAVAARPAPPD